MAIGHSFKMPVLSGINHTKREQTLAEGHMDYGGYSRYIIGALKATEVSSVRVVTAKRQVVYHSG